MKEFDLFWPNVFDEMCQWRTENIFLNENNLELLKMLG